MDFADPHTLQLFLEVYGTLPRAGPGGTHHTQEALRAVPNKEIQTLLDLGCGPGAQTLDLAAALPQAKILALDILPAMVEEARRRIRTAGLQTRVRVEVGDMAAPALPPRSQDLIWCEGAIYNLGIGPALKKWRPLLSDGGTIAFTDAIWLQSPQPKELVDWWQSEYPAITDEQGVRDIISQEGYKTLAFFALPAQAWWTDYYAPMQSRISQLLASHPTDPVAAEIAAGAEHEIDMHQRYSDFYSYGFFVVQPERDEQD